MRFIDIWDSLMAAILTVRHVVWQVLKIILVLFVVFMILPPSRCGIPPYSSPCPKYDRTKSMFCNIYGQKDDDSYLFCKLRL